MLRTSIGLRRFAALPPRLAVRPPPPSPLTCQSPPFEVTPAAPRQKSAESNQTLAQRLRPYYALTKPRLTVLVTLLCVCSYALLPLLALIPKLLFLTTGTALCLGAANAINMGREPEYDGMMTRTSTRPVVRGAVTPRQAYAFAAASGTAGVALLGFGVNPVVALLGFLNIVLYAWTYTLLKRRHIVNTWVGAVVGAIPPLMGWASLLLLAEPGPWLLAGILYAWQFPHFNALSHAIRHEYKRAGYVMTAFENPKLNARVALRYLLLMFPLCIGLSYYGVCDWYFLVDLLVLNGWLVYGAVRFWWQQRLNHRGAAPLADAVARANVFGKQLFWGSVLQLPGILVLAMLHKKGQWDGLWEWMFGGMQ